MNLSNAPVLPSPVFTSFAYCRSQKPGEVYKWEIPTEAIEEGPEKIEYMLNLVAIEAEQILGKKFKPPVLISISNSNPTSGVILEDQIKSLSDSPTTQDPSRA